LWKLQYYGGTLLLAGFIHDQPDLVGKVTMALLCLVSSDLERYCYKAL
jgi:hypothetical protein